MRIRRVAWERMVVVVVVVYRRAGHMRGPCRRRGAWCTPQRGCTRGVWGGNWHREAREDARKSDRPPRRTRGHNLKLRRSGYEQQCGWLPPRRRQASASRSGEGGRGGEGAGGCIASSSQQVEQIVGQSGRRRRRALVRLVPPARGRQGAKVEGIKDLVAGSRVGGERRRGYCVRRQRRAAASCCGGGGACRAGAALLCRLRPQRADGPLGAHRHGRRRGRSRRRRWET